jgi:hypothetical protein
LCCPARATIRQARAGPHATARPDRPGIDEQQRVEVRPGAAEVDERAARFRVGRQVRVDAQGVGLLAEPVPGQCPDPQYVAAGEAAGEQVG